MFAFKRENLSTKHCIHDRYFSLIEILLAFSYLVKHNYSVPFLHRDVRLKECAISLRLLYGILKRCSILTFAFFISIHEIKATQTYFHELLIGFQLI